MWLRTYRRRYVVQLTSGNLHINIVAQSYDPAVETVIEPYIYEWVASVRYVATTDKVVRFLPSTVLA